MASALIKGHTDGIANKNIGCKVEQRIIDLINGLSSTSPLICSLFELCDLVSPNECDSVRAVIYDKSYSKTDIIIDLNDVPMIRVQVKSSSQKSCSSPDRIFNLRQKGNQLHCGKLNIFLHDIGASDDASITTNLNNMCNNEKINYCELLSSLKKYSIKIINRSVLGNDEDSIPLIHFFVAIEKTSTSEVKITKCFFMKSTTFCEWLAEGTIKSVSGGLYIGRLLFKRRKDSSILPKIQSCFSFGELFESLAEIGSSVVLV